MLSTDQISFKSTDDVIYENEYTKNLGGKNSLYLIFNNVDAYIECVSTKESIENKYLIFVSTDKNKETLENYTELWDEIKDQIEAISANKPIVYKKDFMKIKFESDNDLPLGKILSIPVYIIAVRSVFQENNNYYPQLYIYANVCMNLNINMSVRIFMKQNMHQLHKASFIHQLNKVSFIHCFCFSFFSDKISIFKLFYASVT